jgi:two-component system, OmpR family, phosphate regulon sensor histidine kinase PhoR
VALGVAGGYAASFLPLLVTPGAPTGPEWVESLVIPIVVSLVVVVARVLTARYDRAAEQLVAAFEARRAATAESERLDAVLRSIVDGVEVGLLFLDADGRAVVSNDALIEFGRLARYDSVTRAGSRMFAADQVTPMAPDDQPLSRLERGESIEGLLHWVGPRGGQRALVANGGRVHRDDGTLVGSMLVVQDITELLRAGRAREDALATLAHELRTPLTSIVGYTDLLLVDDLPAGAAERVAIVARNAEHLLQLTTAFLDGLHRDAEVHRERLGVRDLIEHTIDVLRTTPGFGERQVQLDVSDELSVTADRDGVGAVLSNLLNNAVKFSRVCDRIDISAAEDEVGVAIVVRNTGSQIDDADLERIFDRFYRGANAQRAAVAGTGIGLSVSRDIAAAHGGTLTAAVEDDAVSFTLCLPGA